MDATQRLITPKSDAKVKARSTGKLQRGVVGFNALSHQGGSGGGY